MDRLKQAREAQGITIRQLSDMTGIDAKNLCNIENGKTDPRISTVKKICESLGLILTIK